MGLGVSVGRLSGAAIAFAGLTASCGGQSSDLAANEGSAGDSGTAGASSGGAAATGSVSSGGTSSGGTGAGGSLPAGGSGAAAGSTPTGGAGPCPDCPAEAYGLVVHGDGASFSLPYNGSIGVNAADAVACAEQPVRGGLVGCGAGIYVSACADPMSGPPCLSINGTVVAYVDRETGALWNGSVTTAVSVIATDPNVASGTVTISLTNGLGDSLALSVDYTLCALYGRLASICR